MAGAGQRLRNVGPTRRSWDLLLAVAVVGSVLFLTHARAAISSYLTVDGEVTTPLSLSEADFKALARVSLTVKDETGRDETYEGADLAGLLLHAGVPLRTDLMGADVAKYLHSEGSDGFTAAFSLPEFDHQAFLVADTLNGAPLSTANGPLQIISPSESRHSRWVKHLTLLRIKKTQK